MTNWNGPAPKPDYSTGDWAKQITKIAIEKTDDDLNPWSIWGRDYATGLVTEEVEDYSTFTEAVSAAPAFFERYRSAS